MKAPMPRVPWHVFKDRNPRAHLVAASVQAAEAVGSSDLKIAQTVLQRLIKKLDPAGDYATAIVRDAGDPEVHLAFENELDARKLADSVQAKAAYRDAGWASERVFQLDAASLAAMASGLPLPPKGRSPTR
jgi:hypothetical protein